ncbi:MAG: GNAT family N-acetyltransferase [Chloroflexi bacterium]|nr:GNAT family N-acetyltransferase [Chloroflexota bacterium]
MRIPEAPTLTDGVATLRHWRPEDAPAVQAACSDPLVQRFIPVPIPYTIEHANEFLETRRRGWALDDAEKAFAIEDAASGQVIGAISRHRPEGHRVSFGYWLAPWGRGRGAMTHALRLITDWTLETAGFLRLEVSTDIDNDASGAVALRAGFEHEGTRRAWSLDREGNPRDSVFYVRIRTPHD